MLRTMRRVAALAVLALAEAGGTPATADINVGVKIGITPPPVVLAPPPLVVVPGTPVHHVPTANFNLFVYRDRFYSFHNGTWFVATGHRAPWTVIAVDAVPAPVRGVPVKHYKIPPGHAKKMEHPEGAWCPPGQAKKGRC